MNIDVHLFFFLLCDDRQLQLGKYNCAILFDYRQVVKRGKVARKAQGRDMVRLRIKEVAQAKGYTQNSLSRATDISLNTIRKLWNQPYSGVKVETLHKIARVLQVDISELTTYEDD